MKIISLEISGDFFVLKGEINSLVKHRVAKKIIRNRLKPTIISDTEWEIEFNEFNKEEILFNLQSFFEKYEYRIEYTDIVKDVLKDYFQKTSDFNEFSKAALNIRNNEINTKDFEEFSNILREKLPSRKLYPLQLLSAFHLSFAQNACNFSVPGAGKTSIVYGAYIYLKSLSLDNSRKVDKILIIGPLSSFGPWEKEYNDCFGERPSVKRLSGNGTNAKEKKDYLYSNSPSEITLMSYQSVANSVEGLIYFLKKNKVMLVLDEAHKIKNTSGGKTATAVMELAKFASSRVILTGTPVPNGYEDLYNIYNFIWPKKDIIGFRLNQLKDMTSEERDPRIDELIENISPFFIRIRKKDLGIPEPIINPPIIVEMGKVQRKIYDYIENKYMEFIIESGNYKESMHSMLVKARLIRLMQAATNPAALKKPLERYFDSDIEQNDIFIDDSEVMDQIMNYKEHEVPNKFIEAAKLIKEIISRGEKVIIWVVYIKTIHDLSEYLESLGIKNKLLYGAVPVDSGDDNEDIDTRERIVEEFHEENSDFKVIIANPFAVSESISLHKACNNAIYIERTFNAAQFIQSKDRIHRYGLKENDIVNYHFLLSENSVDETIDERLRIKENRMTEIIESQEIPLFNNLNDDEDDNDIKALIKHYVQRT